MSVHSCYCIIFCIAWFEVRFRIELKFHFELALKKLEKEKNKSLLLPKFRPIGLLFRRGRFFSSPRWPALLLP